MEVCNSCWLLGCPMWLCNGEGTRTGRNVHDVDMDGGTARLDGTPRRRADLVGIEAVELEPACDELVDYGGRHLRLGLCARAVIPDLGPPKIVGEDMDDVGLPGGGGGADEEKGGEADVLGNHEPTLELHTLDFRPPEDCLSQRSSL